MKLSLFYKQVNKSKTAAHTFWRNHECLVRIRTTNTLHRYTDYEKYSGTSIILTIKNIVLFYMYSLHSYTVEPLLYILKDMLGEVISVFNGEVSSSRRLKIQESCRFAARKLVLYTEVFVLCV